MSERRNRIQVWLSDAEKRKLESCKKKCGLSQEAYIRSLICGYVPKELPPDSYYEMMAALNAIGVDLSSMSASENQDKLNDTLDKLCSALIYIQDAVTQPEKFKYGDHKD